MTGKDRRFPLSLSAVVEKTRTPDRRNIAGPRVATPQTATQNVAFGLTQAVTAASTRGLEQTVQQDSRQRAHQAPSLRAAPLVSNGVRTAMVARVAKQGVKDTKVLAALEAVPRHMFIEPALSAQAYIDASLPIGHHQTISQPYIVARMIEVLRANSNDGRLDKVLEIGTGCGYQAAVLSQVATEVFSIERIKPLHELAKANLRPLRIANIRLQYGDGMLGLPQAAPFDGIILAAAGMQVPQALLDQMSIGGRLVAPIGAHNQVLQLIERVSRFEWTRTTLEDCHFVPLRPGVV